MLSTLLDARTLAHLWDAPGPAVQRTIEAGGWGGCLWPGHEEWADMATMSPDDIRAGSQLFSLGLHSFPTLMARTRRSRPEAALGGRRYPDDRLRARGEYVCGE